MLTLLSHPCSKALETPSWYLPLKPGETPVAEPVQEEPCRSQLLCGLLPGRHVSPPSPPYLPPTLGTTETDLDFGYSKPETAEEM